MNEPQFCAYCGRPTRDRPSATGTGHIFRSCPKSQSIVSALFGTSERHTNVLTDRREVPPAPKPRFDTQTGTKL